MRLIGAPDETRPRLLEDEATPPEARDYPIFKNHADSLRPRAPAAEKLGAAPSETPGDAPGEMSPTHDVGSKTSHPVGALTQDMSGISESV